MKIKLLFLMIVVASVPLEGKQFGAQEAQRIARENRIRSARTMLPVSYLRAINVDVAHHYASRFNPEPTASAAEIRVQRIDGARTAVGAANLLIANGFEEVTIDPGQDSQLRESFVALGDSLNVRRVLAQSQKVLRDLGATR